MRLVLSPGSKTRTRGLLDFPHPRGASRAPRGFHDPGCALTSRFAGREKGLSDEPSDRNRIESKRADEFAIRIMESGATIGNIHAYRNFHLQRKSSGIHRETGESGGAGGMHSRESAGFIEQESRVSGGCRPDFEQRIAFDPGDQLLEHGESGSRKPLGRFARGAPDNPSAD